MDTGLAKLTLADTSLTFLWVVCTSCLGIWSGEIARYLEWQGPRGPIVITIVAILMMSFSISAKALGGATWNPTGPVAFYAAGVGKDTPFTLAIRLPATAVGGTLGALTIVELMPEAYKHTLGGPRLKVGLHTGAFAEGVLTFSITLVVLLTILKGPASSLIKSFIVITATIIFVNIGAPYTGPAMNPANAFAWAYVNKNHTSNEHLYVYWVTPFLGALAAAGVFRLLFNRGPPRAPKTEKTE